MKAPSLICLCSILAIASEAPAQNPQAKLDEYVTRATSLGRFSGSVLVAHRGVVLLSKGYGLANQEWDHPNTPQTKFRIGSVTKPFTATAIMLLQQRGQLSVGEPVCKYVADCPTAWRDISIHHLLSHTSGIPNYMGFPDYALTMRDPSDVAGLIARFRDKSLDFAPGTDHRYSNSGYILLGHIIERVSGVGYGQFVRANILTPVGMANTGYDVPFRVLNQRASGYSRANGAVINAPFIAMSITHSAGALFSTVEDLYAFDQALYGDKLLSAKSLDSMFTVVRNNYGYGWGVDRQFNRRRLEHNGQVNGFTSIFSRYPDDRLTVIVLTNSDQTVPGVNRVARDLAAIVFGEPYELPSAAPSVAVSPSVLAEYVGQYELAANYFVAIARTATGLTVQLTGSPPFEMRAESATTFAVDVVDARIVFVRGTTGAVTELVLQQGAEQRARKIR